MLRLDFNELGLRWWHVLLAAVAAIAFIAAINPGLASFILVVGGAGWIGSNWLRDRRERLLQSRIGSAIARCVTTHKETLVSARDLTLSWDEYGKVEDIAWRKEVKRFTRRVVLDEVPEARLYSERSIVEFTRQAIERLLGKASPKARQFGF